MEPTPLQHLLQKKAWTLSHLKIKLDENKTPCSYPTLLMIKNGYRSKRVKNKDGQTTKGKIKYNPHRRTLTDIAKIFKVTPEEIYQDRSKN